MAVRVKPITKIALKLFIASITKEEGTERRITEDEAVQILLERAAPKEWAEAAESMSRRKGND